MIKNGENKNCIVCNIEFYVPKWRKVAKYCSYTCYWNNKHDIPWNKNSRGLQKLNKTSYISYGLQHKEEIPNYKAIHAWMYYHYGKPVKCEECNKTFNTRGIHWANVSGKYMRVRSDWRRLCNKCHRMFDFNRLPINLLFTKYDYPTTQRNFL